VRVRDAFTAELKEMIEFLATVMPRTGRSRGHDDAIVALASMAGALILARAVSDERLSNRILKTTAKWVLHVTRSAIPSTVPRRTSARTKSFRLAK
jgi:hypothetical protein